MDLHHQTIHELRNLLDKGEISSEELTQKVLSHIEQTEKQLHAFITITPELALEAAKRFDQSRQAGKKPGALAGIPLGIKDNFLTKGSRTTCGSKILGNYIAPYSGTSTQRLLDAGGVMVGKLNMDEFAMGSSNETSAFGEVHNPWDLELIPGGSSGGSAAAVAAGQCSAATGTDTGGSIRLPAALCNLVGMKPTYGRVSRYGVIAFASSLDQVGPLTKDVTDAALMLQVLAGHDPLDSTSLDVPVPHYAQSLVPDVKGWKIGIPKEYFVAGMDPEVEAAMLQAIKTLEGLGAQCGEVSLPHTDYGVPVYYILATAEASSNLARYDGIRYGYRNKEAKELISLYEKSRTEGFGDEVKRRIMLGTYVLSAGYYDAYYLKAQKARTLIRQDFTQVFKNYDVILTPVSPTAAWKLKEKTGDPLKMYLSDIFTINVNLAGLPGMSLPCGFTQGGLPIGMQLIGDSLQEEKLLRMGYAYEQATEWHKRRPKL